MKVRCMTSMFDLITCGSIYEVIGEIDNYYIIKRDTGEIAKYSKNRFEVVKDKYSIIQNKIDGMNFTYIGYDKGEKEMDNKKREFNFVLPSIVAYKRSEWEQDLTRENPLIVTRIDGVTDFMIHDYILDKARFLRIRLPDITNTDQDIAHLTEWVKYVKSCDWEDKKVSVKVIIPKI